MNQPRHDLEPEDADDLAPLAEQLVAARPLPHPAYRGELRRRLLRSPHATRARPRHLWARVAACAGSGTALLLLALLGVQGGGPLGG
jgi:hypothetical protein